MAADHGTSDWQSRYDASIEEADRAVSEELEAGRRIGAYFREAALMLGFIGIAVSLVLSGNAWLIAIGVVLLLLTVLIVVGFVVEWRRSHSEQLRSLFDYWKQT